MTTIAYDGECIAVDSRRTVGRRIATDDALKIRECRTVQGFIVLAGTSMYNDLMAEEFAPGEEAHADVDGIGFYVDSHGRVWAVGVDEGRYIAGATHTYGPHWAFGSGEEWAIAAMDMGKNAVEAVRYAATRDVCTGGLIRRLDLKTLKVKTFKK